MKRRTFVRLATVTTAALYFPNLHCRAIDSAMARVLSRPVELQHICDAKTIHDIGLAYQHQVAGETGKSTLINLLAVDSNNQPIDERADSGLVASLVAKKVQQDFDQNKTIVVDGWVLSVTEARQCALFSLIEN